MLNDFDYSNKIIIIGDSATGSRNRITQSYYRGADAAIIVYDVTCLESFNHVRSWLKDLYNYSDSEIKKVLVGNKVDQKDSRRVSYDEGKKLADDYGILFFETSAFDGQNVEEAFVAAVKEKKEPRKTSFTPSQVEEILLTEQAGDDSSDEGGKKTTSSSCKC
ncbi:hypothetical protein C9374_014513 [Naegleria lovaniensis]|uniref:Rab family small GTPase n=1 Tax=Naegleria lovaniensis TaxID=51637 RepID=A0AA88H120_NAELO|nr:uncharacterized protein C9374_014513 [Naegleria lovaniensis]KAG2389113.1 hypothetical protein C9374_014513 [Naegleria lovaniensis]